MSGKLSGLLAIWNDIVSGGEADFRHWHSGEHMPERMGVPGFQRGRRLFNDNAQPRWLTLYEADEAAVFSSPAYLERLNSPSPWTQATLPSFAATERMGAVIACRHGRGRGGIVATIRLWATTGSNADLDSVLVEAMATAGALAGVVARAIETPQQTKERGLRPGDLAPPDAVLLLELSSWPDDTALSIEASISERSVTDLYRLEHEITPTDVDPNVFAF